MPFNALPALQVAAPQNNTLANFEAARQSSINAVSAQQEQTQQTMKALAVMGLSALNGDINGKADPATWESVLDHAEQSGVSPDVIKRFRGRPDLAGVLARGSLDVLKYAQDQAQMDMAMRKFDLELQQAAGQTPAAQLDMDYKRAQIDALKAKPPVTPTDDQRELEQINAERKAAGQEPMSMETFLAGKKNAGLSVTLPDGTVIAQGNTPKLTEGQSKDLGFYVRGKGANDALAGHEGELTNWFAQVASQGGSGALWGLGNYATSGDFKNAQRNANEFLAVILRKDTGAAVTPKEWDFYGPLYLPMPGDGPEQMKQKAAARDRALEAVRAGLGPAEIILKEMEYRKEQEQGGQQSQQQQPGETNDLDPSTMSDQDLLDMLN